ncbi:MAG: NADH-quinone oxidoreductase subunit L [Polyangiaceae bacterium]
MHTLQVVFPDQDFTLLAVILGLPLIGAFINGVFGKRLGRQGVTLMALSAVGGAFIAAVTAFFMLRTAQGHEEHAVRFSWTAWEWLSLSTPNARPTLSVKFSLDALNSTMSLIVTGVGFLIHLYSSKYMEEDPGYYRFFAYLNLFIVSRLVLILGDSLPILFVGGEGVGLCSYLLIGFWFHEDANAAAGKKAFIANRIGDFGLLCAMGLLLSYTGALDWAGIEAGAAGLAGKTQIWPLGNDVPLAHYLGDWLSQPRYADRSTLVALFLFLGCAGKSAQFPLYVWLPDAMAGPTPVSALIHAATMVTAGVYLMCRMSGVFVMAPTAMLVIALVGAFTALLAATIALVQNDIKKVLAYSTVSQLGYMFIGTGVGAFTAGFFHVMTHAFFKACLFLGAGSVIHAMHARIHDTDASQDMRNMGGMKAFMPLTHWTFLISCIAIAGIPPLAGFWSKDEILYMAYTQGVTAPDSVRAAYPELAQWPAWAGKAIYGMGLLGAVMTAFYMFRLYFRIFHGEFKGWKIVKNWVDPHAHDAHGDDHHDDHAHHEFDPDEPREGPKPHESPWQMTTPLVILAGLAAVAGFLNAPLLHMHALEHWLEPVFKLASTGVKSIDPDHHMMLTLAVPGVLVGVAGVGIAWFFYISKGGEPAAQLVEKAPGVHRFLMNKWWMDEFYEETFIGAVDALAEFFTWADKWIVDGIVARLTAGVVQVTGTVLRYAQTGRVQAYAAAMVLGTACLGWFMLTPHASAKPFENHRTGSYRVEAAPGLGYSYRWSSKQGDGDFQYEGGEEFGDQRTTSFNLDRGAERTVRLEVQDAFGHHSSWEYAVTRPKDDRPPGSAPANMVIQQDDQGRPHLVLPPGHPAPQGDTQ